MHTCVKQTSVSIITCSRSTACTAISTVVIYTAAVSYRADLIFQLTPCIISNSNICINDKANKTKAVE